MLHEKLAATPEEVKQPPVDEIGGLVPAPLLLVFSEDGDKGEVEKPFEQF
jgi:hypothetical protein